MTFREREAKKISIIKDNWRCRAWKRIFKIIENKASKGRIREIIIYEVNGRKQVVNFDGREQIK